MKSLTQRCLKLFTLVFFIGITSFSYGQEALLTERMESFPTYSFGDPNPLPAFLFNPKIYPYHKFQGYALKQIRGSV
jgi:hypothetical protein